MLAHAQGITEIIAITGQAAPDGNGILNIYNTSPAINNSGEVVFPASLTGTLGGASDNTAILVGSGGPLTQIVREGQAPPDGNGKFSDVRSVAVVFALNSSGEVTFTSLLDDTADGDSDRTGIFRGAGGAITQIARGGQVAPDGNGVLHDLSYFGANNTGQAVISAELGDTSDDSGIFVGSGGVLTQIAREGQAAPDGNGTISSFINSFELALNNNGQAAFFATLTGTSGGASDDRALFRGSGGALTQIVREGQAAPDGNGTFGRLTWLRFPMQDTSGAAVFVASLNGTSAGTTDDRGIFRGGGGAITQIAREGQSAPDGDGILGSISSPEVNSSGQAVFSARLIGNAGGESDDLVLYRSNPGTSELTQLLRKGQPAPNGVGLFQNFDIMALNASGEAAVSGFYYDGPISSRGPGISLVNGIDVLQVARTGDPLDGSTNSGNGFIFNTSRYTNGNERSGINDAGQVVYKTSLTDGRDAIVRFTIPDIYWTTTVGGDWETSENWTDQTLPNSFHHTFIAPDTTLTVTGPTADDTLKSLTLGGGVGVATLQLSGVTTGDLRTLQASTIASNGVLQLADGRQFSAPALANSGVIEGSGAIDAVLTNAASGTINVADNATLTFHDDVTNNGALNVAAGSTAVFLGSLSGDGAMGAGSVQALGGVSPASSPGVMTFGGDLTLGPAASLEIEIGGATPVAEYDRVEVEGIAQLDGTLKVELIDLGSGVYEPQLGDSFAFLASNGGAGGMWHTLDLPQLAPGLEWMLNPGGVTISLNVVAALPGDYNFDGVVDAADYAVWREALGQTGNGLAADGDLSGVVDSADFTIWRDNYGASLPASASISAPEPAALLLALFAAAFSVARRRD